MTRLAPSTIVIEYEGRSLTLMQLAREKGLAYYTLSGRYQSGDRDADLIRPLRTPSSRAVALRKLKAVARQEAEHKDYGPVQHMQGKAKPNPKSLTRQQTRREAIERARIAHAAAFARPLISGELLTPDERNAIHHRVGSGLRWHGVASGEPA